MSDSPVLVADIGFATTSGTLVADGESVPLREPASGSRLWPTAVALDLPGGPLIVGTPAMHRRRIAPTAFRHDFLRDLGRSRPLWIGGRPFHARSCVAALLRALRAEADRLGPAPVRHLLLTCPGSYLRGEADPRRAALQAAGRQAGFTEVQLLAAPLAAALAPPAGPGFAPDETVLVYDLGAGTFDTALVRFLPDGTVREEGSAMTLDFHGGADLDALIAADVRRSLPDSATGPAGRPTDPVVAAQTGQLVAEFARRIKHRLSSEPAATDVLLPGAPPYTLERERLAELAAELLADTVACSRRLLAANGTAPDELAGVLATGGSTRLPFVTERLAAAFGRPVHRPLDASLAVVQGAAAWLRREPRRLAPAAGRPGSTPLTWPLPPGGAVLDRWLTSPGARYRPGQALAVLRGTDGGRWQLEAPAAAGVVRDLHAGPGARITAGQWPVTVGPAPLPDRPEGPGSVLEPPAVTHRLLHGDRLQWIAFHPSGRELATAGGTAGIRVHGVGRRPVVLRELAGTGEATSLAYRPDGTQLLCSSSQARPGSAVRLYDGGSGELLRTVSHPKWIYQAVFAPDGLSVASSADDRVVRVHRTADGLLLGQLPHPERVKGVGFAPDGGTLATACADGALRLWDLVSGRVRHVRLGGDVRWLAFAPDGRSVAATSARPGGPGRTVAEVLVHETESGALLATLGHAEPVTALAFSPDGALLATACRDGRARLHATEDWQLRYTLDHDGPVWAVAFAPDGRTLATGTERGTAVLWQLTPKPG
ncbi:Hsp70 family protein [Kitasatospora sp. KL5]|uniref:Hsp70 family protein n=1 Tax=Kitasatospora sp. KL5 TaxID=3425125 RepID=UPI003D6FEAD9